MFWINLIFLFYKKNLIKFCKNEEDILKLKSDLEMLIDKDKMGKRFKFISIRKFDFEQTPIGFESI